MKEKIEPPSEKWIPLSWFSRMFWHTCLGCWHRFKQEGYRSKGKHSHQGGGFAYEFLCDDCTGIRRRKKGT